MNPFAFDPAFSPVSSLPRFLHLRRAVVLSIGLVLAAVASAQTILIDFGTAQVPSSPADGYYWNTVYNTNVSDLVDIANVSSGVGLTFIHSASQSNTGAADPVSGLGLLAVAEATSDFVYTATNALDMKFVGLDANLVYDFTVYGARETTGERYARYTVTSGENVYSFVQQNSGATGANGSEGSFLDLTYFVSIAPDENGEIFFTMETESGSFGYINAVQVVGTSAVPEPATTTALCAAAVLGFVAMRRRRRAVSETSA